MLAPQELINKEFTKALRGYSTAEVDEHLDFVIGKYTEIYREYEEMQKRLRKAEAKLNELESEEAMIHSALVNAQKASAQIIAEANEQADVIMTSAKNSCNRLLSEFKNDISVENNRLNNIRREISAFKAALFDGYRSHIEMVERIAPEAELSKHSSTDPEALANLVLSRIKEDLTGKDHIISGAGVPFSEPAAEPEPPEDAPDVHLNAEVSIPEDVTAAYTDDPFSIRDAADFASEPKEPSSFGQEEDDEDFLFGNEPDDGLPVERENLQADRESGSGIVDSIMQLNDDMFSFDDDDDFLKILENADDTSADDKQKKKQFDLVYNDRKRK